MINVKEIKASDNNLATKAILVNEFSIGNVHIYDDTNFKDRNYGWNLEYPGTDYVAIPHLKTNYDFNDKISSIKQNIPNSYVDQIVFEAWENDNYSGRSLVLLNIRPPMLQPTGTYVGYQSNLKTIPCGSGNWNDRITSFILYWKGHAPGMHPNPKY